MNKEIDKFAFLTEILETFKSYKKLAERAFEQVSELN